LQLIIISRAIACPTRLYLLGVLGPEGRSVSEAAASADVSISTASYHLHVLERAGLARMRRRGRSNIFRWGKDRWFLTCRPVTEGIEGAPVTRVARASR